MSWGRFRNLDRPWHFVEQGDKGSGVACKVLHCSCHFGWEEGIQKGYCIWQGIWGGKRDDDRCIGLGQFRVTGRGATESGKF
jgi:hypothetical protein